MDQKSWKLNKNREQDLKKRVKELESTDAADLWKTFKDGVLKACDEVCKKKSRQNRGGMSWWNKKVKNATAK